MEKIDIENEEYEAWDKDGFPVELKLQEPVNVQNVQLQCCCAHSFIGMGPFH